MVEPMKTDRRKFIEQTGIAAVAGFVSVGAKTKTVSREASLAKGGQGQAAIVVGRNAGSFYRWVAGELQKYLHLLTGAELPVVSMSEAPLESTKILLGGPGSNEAVAEAQQKKLIEFTGLKKDGFLIQSLNLDGKPVVVVGGNDEAATMYAAYELLERLGVVFQLTNDIIPERKPDLTIPAMSVRMEPVLKYRGLHFRHFVMPWMGMDYFRKFLDQQAKMKSNYLEFYWYVGDPWTEYSYRGEKRLIGDIYTKESGYTTWRINTATFTASDIKIGREHFTEERVCASEFQDVQTPEEAHRTARQLLRQVIDYAHLRKIQIWLGMGDCPGVPPNLGAHTQHGQSHSWTGVVIPPGEPAGLGIWISAAESMIQTYPKADGFWIWLAEGYFHSDDPQTGEVIRSYDQYRELIPSPEQIKQLGYNRPTTQQQIESDIGLVHYGKTIAERVKTEHPSVQFGLAVLGRSYLFPLMDAVIPKDVAFSSMESSAVWNRPRSSPPWTGTTFEGKDHHPVPMRLFGIMGERERFLIPRLDDDATEFGMQFNVGLYCYDQVLEGSVANGVVGVAPQTGKLRGLEHNAKFIAEGGWNPSINANDFYSEYARKLFGGKGAEPMAKALLVFHEFEAYLGWRGLDNFRNYGPTQDIRMLGGFKRQSNPFDGPNFDLWDVRKNEQSASLWIEKCKARRDRYAGGIELLNKGRDQLKLAQGKVALGSTEELEYMLFKTNSYISHLEAVRSLLGGYIAYDRAFRSKLNGHEKEMLEEFGRGQVYFLQARDQARETAQQLTRCKFAMEPTEKYILFCYNVRFLVPIAEFCKFIKNVVNFHHGQPYWEKVDWEVIAPKQWMDA